MRLTLAVLCVAVCSSMASAQTQSEQRQPVDSEHSTGRTMLPDDDKRQPQPQGRTGPITTGSGGAPAESPQGQALVAFQIAHPTITWLRSSGRKLTFISATTAQKRCPGLITRARISCSLLRLCSLSASRLAIAWLERNAI
jgi:hypothetical protein